MLKAVKIPSGKDSKKPLARVKPEDLERFINAYTTSELRLISKVFFIIMYHFVYKCFQNLLDFEAKNFYDNF